MNPNFSTIGSAFVTEYYKLFDSNRANLKMFYVRVDTVFINNQHEIYTMCSCSACKIELILWLL